jgi:hypothetical protein
MIVKITAKGIPNIMNILGKLPEAPSARWTLNGVDLAKIARLCIVVFAGIAVKWLATHAAHPFTFTPEDLATIQSEVIMALIIPGLETLRRLSTDGTDPQP